VTFTEAAADEMRSRVRQAMQMRIGDSSDERLVQQLASIERATIGTLHAFCGRLLRQYFYAAGLDPNFAILDGDTATLLKRETARALIAERFKSRSSLPFHALLNDYFDGDDNRLVTEMLVIYETLNSLPAPDAWLVSSRQRLEESADGRLDQSPFGKLYLHDIAQDIGALQARIAAAEKSILHLGNFPPYIEALTDAASIVANWQTTLQEAGVDALAEEADFQPPKLPNVSNSIPNKAPAKKIVDGIRDEMKKGALRSALRFTEPQWLEGMTRTLGPAKELLSLVEDFSASYTAAKMQLRSLDFSDLEHKALKLLSTEGDLSKPSIVARSCHQRYAHVLVDEYQDINELQEAILRLVSRECLGPANSNLFCVGDVKQSIYRFRSAEPELFLRRYDRFKMGDGGQLIGLNTNFRSRKPLLEALNAIFERLMTRPASGIDYAAGHRLEAGRTFPPGATFSGAPIELHLLPDDPQSADDGATDGSEMERAEREAAFIVHRIRSLMGLKDIPRATITQHDGTTREIHYGDIAILLRTRKYKIEQYADILRKSGIPVLAEGGAGFFSAMEVQDMVALLHLLDNFRQDLPLVAFLRSPLGRLPESEDCLARIRLAYPDPSLPFHVAVEQYAAEQDDELAARLRDVIDQLNQWRQRAQRRPLAETIAAIYEESGYLSFVSGLEDGRQRKANLLELHQRAAQFGRLESGAAGLSRFLSFLQDIADEVDAGQAAMTSAAIDAVRIVTIHKSKGLEFPVVFVADLGKHFNLSNAQGSIIHDKDDGLGLKVVDDAKLVRYPSLATTVIEPRLKRKMLAEELRVLYVALTRAEELLILVGTTKPNQAEQWLNRWRGHEGALPADEILKASSALGWLVPVAVAAGESVMTIIAHDAIEPLSATNLNAESSGRLAAIAALKPLDPPAPLNAIAAEVIERLSYIYPHASFTRAAASQSVTARAHRGETVETAFMDEADGHDPATQAAKAPATSADGSSVSAMERPRFVSQAQSAADVGTATHLVLEYFDFSPAAQPIAQQIQALLASRRITAEQAKAVDIESIQWLLNSDAGRLLAANSDNLLRELPVYFSAAVDDKTAAPSTDPLDRVMVRGRLDLFVPTAGKDYIIDYKTDRVEGELLEQRIAAYRLQMAAYADALSAITGKRPIVWLIFLSHRRLVEV
jgi:ATP-dependent helicase/nuclease subunit A